MKVGSGFRKVQRLEPGHHFLEPHERMRFLGRTAQKQMLHRVTGYDVVENRSRPVGDCLDDEDVLGRAKGRVPGILAVGTFVLVLAGQNLALDHDLRLRGHLDINCLALDQFDWLAEERACNLEFVDLHRHFGGCRDVDRRMNTYADRDFQITAARFAALQMLPDMPPLVQACPKLFRALELKPLIAEVTSPGIGVLAHKNAGSDVATSIRREVTTNRQSCGVNLRSDPHDLLDCPMINDPGGQDVGEGLYPSLIESARLGTDHTSDPVAAGEQIRHDRRIEPNRPINQDDGRLATVFELEDESGGNMVDVNRV